jgi:hypothetical protein
MDNNIIYVSDASFDPHTKAAGIGIKNLNTHQTHSLILTASSAQEAEEFALLEAINHATLHHHRNCVFVYDNINLDTNKIGAFFGGLFDRIQFLWMKRDYLKEVDALAKTVRSKKSNANSYTKQILSRASIISDEELVSALMPLTRGETYGYLCALSSTAPMMKPYSRGIKEVNEKIVSLLMMAGSNVLINRLKERFKPIRLYKHKLYDELLESAGFSMEWFDDAAYECRYVRSAA